MSRKIFLFLFGIVFLFPHLVFGSVLINEMMYAPESGDSEWIEIFNSGGDSADLTDWRFFNNEEDSAPLRLQKGDIILPAGGYAIITKTSNWSSFSGTVFSSSQFSLPNDSSKYNTYKAISNVNKEIIDYVDYITTSDAFNNGNSLQLINNNWISAPSTLGIVNQTQSNSSPEVNTISGTVEENNTVTITTSKQKIKTEIITEKFAFVGLPIYFQATSFQANGGRLLYGKYFWNFGDGDSKEMKVNEMGKFAHVYFYPGSYEVNLEYYVNYYTEKPKAVDKVIVNVISPDIIISSVGNEKDFFVELTNNTNYDADISKWILVSNRVNFTFPKNTILKSKKKIIISPHITNFSIEDKNTLKLTAPHGEVIYNYLPSVAPAPIVKKKTPQPLIIINDNSLITEPLELLGRDSVENLSASPILSETGNNNYIPMFALVLFLGVTSSAVYFIRRQKSLTVPGDDFELIDE